MIQITSHKSNLIHLTNEVILCRISEDRGGVESKWRIAAVKSLLSGGILVSKMMMCNKIVGTAELTSYKYLMKLGKIKQKSQI